MGSCPRRGGSQPLYCSLHNVSKRCNDDVMYISRDKSSMAKLRFCKVFRADVHVHIHVCVCVRAAYSNCICIYRCTLCTCSKELNFLLVN